MGMKLKHYRNVHNICLYKKNVFIAVAHLHLSLWQLKVSRLIMGKVKVGLHFYLSADVLTKVLQKCSLSSPLPKPLNLIGHHGNRNAKFVEKNQKPSLQKP